MEMELHLSRNKAMIGSHWMLPHKNIGPLVENIKISLSDH